jgi:hypothetical protein
VRQESQARRRRQILSLSSSQALPSEARTGREVGACLHWVGVVTAFLVNVEALDLSGSTVAKGFV